jgi:hypothetical protein
VISRRTFIAGSAAAALLAACGGDDGGSSDDTTPDTGGDTSTPESDTPLVPARLGAAFADGFSTELGSLVAGIPQRAPFVVVTDIGEPLRADAPDSIQVEITHNGASVASLTVPKHDANIPTPYYPVTFTPPEAGEYEILADFATEPTTFKVTTREELGIVQVGDKLRPVDTPTDADARGVDPVCTRPTPCPYHRQTLAEAMAAGTPVAFMISTPGFCQTQICGPVLEFMVESESDLSGFALVHAEVYVDPTSGNVQDTTEAIAAYGLGWEPSFYVADATGTVTARLDFLWDEAEFRAAVATAA